MKPIVIVLFLFISAAFSYSQQPVYFAQSIGNKGIILEDHITFHNNLDTWGKSQYGFNYEAYSNYMKDIVKKYGTYSDSVREYSFTDYKPEFAKLTDIKPGDRFYFSTEKDIYLSKVTGYYMRLDDEIGGGNIFYALLKTPKESNEKDVSFDDYELLVATKNGNMSKLNHTGITNSAEIQKFKKTLMPLLKKVEVTDMGDKKVWKKMTSISDDDLKIFKAPLTNAVDANGNLIDLYLVSFCKALSFDDFASGIWIMDSKGKVLKEFSKLKEKDFNYTKVTSIVDTDGDGVYEIITTDGYYEGSGVGLWKYNKDHFDYIASGFAFGV